MCYPKKGFDNIREKLDDTKITDLIKQLKPKYSQEKMCEIFKISRATYYYNLNKTTTKTQERYELLSSQIKRIYEENSKIYGAPKIHVILNREGYPASIKLVQRIMRALGLSSITRKKYKPQTIKSKVEAFKTGFFNYLNKRENSRRYHIYLHKRFWLDIFSFIYGFTYK